MKFSLLTPLLLSLSFSFAACTDEDGFDDQFECTENCDSSLSSAENWFTGKVNTEVRNLSLYASNEPGLGACVSTWTVGGAAVGEAASKVCVVAGVATIETGVGGVAAAVCLAGDALQLDALLGAVAGAVTGFAVCSAQASFNGYFDSFSVYNLKTESGVEVEDWNTLECAEEYEAYKAVCKRPLSCKNETLSCVDLLIRQGDGLQCAQMRQHHLHNCPHPVGFNFDGHNAEIGTIFNVAQICLGRLCTEQCYNNLANTSYAADFDAVCLPTP